MVFQAEDRARTKKQRTEVAIQLALEGRWDDAATLNRSIIDLFPTDVDAYNRLGKAMTELGRYAEARDAYQRALEVDPLNIIAGKNLSRLATLGKKATPRPATQKLSPHMFIEETGKTSVTSLLRPNMKIAARMTAGDQVDLVRDNGSLVIKSIQGEFIGEVELRLAQRLIKLLESGNQYVAAISGLADNDVRVFIRETFQHASQAGKLSFPLAVTEAFRPYLKERLIRKDTVGQAFYNSDEGDDWETGHDVEEAQVTAQKFGRTPRGHEGADSEEGDEEE
ncbi:MAG: tetratricopeptide repeat protein [Dehalococcoidia bacterium]